jgi:hypothetical protein
MHTAAVCCHSSTVTRPHVETHWKKSTPASAGAAQGVLAQVSPTEVGNPSDHQCQHAAVANLDSNSSH